MTGQLGRLEKVALEKKSQPAVLNPLINAWPGSLAGWRRWGKEALVEPSSLQRLRRSGKGWPQVRQGLAPVPELPSGSFESLNRYMTGQLGRPEKVHPSSLEGFRWGKGWRCRTKTAKRQFRNPYKIHDQAAWKVGKGGQGGACQT